jgi:hypothetical protein
MIESENRTAGWTGAAERRWIWWTAIVCASWAAWYLMFPTVRSLIRFAAKIRGGV